MVQVDRPPRWCQTRLTSIHSSERAFPLVSSWRTRSTRISAPPPGMLPRPAAFNRPQHLVERQLVDLVEVPQLRRAEGVQIHLGEPLLAGPEHFLVPFEFQVRVHPALQQDLIAAEGDGLLDLAEQFVVRHHVSVGVGGLAVEGAEVAHGGADVRIVDVPVDVVGPVRFRVQPHRDRVGGPAETVQVPTAHQFEAVGRGQPTAVNGFRQDAVDIRGRGRGQCRGHSAPPPVRARVPGRVRDTCSSRPVRADRDHSG